MRLDEIYVPILRVARHEMLLQTISNNEKHCLEIATELSKGNSELLELRLKKAIEVMKKNTNIYLNY